MQDHPLMARRGTANPDDNLIPLINIVFLLLIFFMVAGQIAPQQDMTIDPPESASEKALEPAELELSLTAPETFAPAGNRLTQRLWKLASPNSRRPARNCVCRCERIRTPRPPISTPCSISCVNTA